MTSALNQPIEEMVAEYRKTDEKVYVLEMIRALGEGVGAKGHPAASNYAQNAEILTQFIKRI